MGPARMASAALLAATMAGSALAAGAGTSARAGGASGFYTEQQAQEGAALYAERCAACHGPALEGTFETPALTGRFVANWAGRPVGDLHAYLGRAMPQFAPGTLSSEENARLVAFLLRANGWPAGAVPLGTAGAALDRVLPAPGPRDAARSGAAKPGAL